MMHKFVFASLLCLLLQGVALLKADSALVIGGFGASDSVQVVTDNDVCLGGNAVPMIPKAPDGRVGWTAQYVDGKVVVCGGAKVDFYSDCYSLQIGSASWQPDGNMNFKKRYAESLVFNGEMLVMGGYNQNQGWLDFVEKRNADGSFTNMPEWKLPRQIYDFCAVDMGNGKIMVLGGNILNGIFDSADMDILDTATNTWSSGPPMAKNRATHDCVVTEYAGEQGVMVTGGCSNNCAYHLKDTSFFSFVTETWTELPPLVEGRMGHKMTILNGKPTVIGGFDESELANIEEFDGTNWVSRAEKMPFGTHVYGSPDAIPEKVGCP